MSLTDNFNVSAKITKSTKLFPFQQKRKLQKFIKKVYETVEIISYKIKFIDSMRFMVTSLSKLVGNLTEEIHKIKCKDCDCFFEYESVQDNFQQANIPVG